MTYGNIGSADRVDFTVIGPAVNLVSRIEAIAKSRDLPLIVSDDFARAFGYCTELPSLGAFDAARPGEAARVVRAGGVSPDYRYFNETSATTDGGSSGPAFEKPLR